MRSKVHETVASPSVCPSVCMSRHSTADAACGGFAAECPAGGWLGSRVVACWTLVEMFNCIIAALLRVARVGALIAGLAESNGSLLPG